MPSDRPPSVCLSSLLAYMATTPTGEKQIEREREREKREAYHQQNQKQPDTNVVVKNTKKKTRPGGGLGEVDEECVRVKDEDRVRDDGRLGGSLQRVREKINKKRRQKTKQPHREKPFQETLLGDWFA